MYYFLLFKLSNFFICGWISEIFGRNVHQYVVMCLSKDLGVYLQGKGSSASPETQHAIPSAEKISFGNPELFGSNFFIQNYSSGCNMYSEL